MESICILYLNVILNQVFAIVFVFGKFIVFVFVFKYHAMYLDPSLVVCNTNAFYITTKFKLPLTDSAVVSRVQ